MNKVKILKTGAFNGWIFLLATLTFQFAVAGSTDPPSTRFPTRLYTMEDGLAHTTVLSIGKDSCGFLWVETLNGLQRFDGTRFKSYKTGYTSELRNMYLDENGEFWVLHATEGELRYDYRRDTFYYPFPYICEKGWHTRCSNGDLWLMDLHTLYLLDEDEAGNAEVRASWNVPDSIGWVGFIYELPDGTMVTGNNKHSCRIAYTGAGFTLSDYPFKIGGLPADPTVISAEAKDQDSLWLVAGSVLVRAGPSIPGEESCVRGERILLDHPGINLHPADVVFTIQYDGNEFLYFRTSHGIYRMNLVTRKVEWIYSIENESYSTTEGSFQRAMYYDPEGILWVGTNHGLVEIIVSQSGFRVYDPGYPTLHTVWVDTENRLWCGSAGGGLFRSIPDRDGRYTRFDRFESNPGNASSMAGNIAAVHFEDASGKLYISSGNWGETRYLQVIENPGDGRLRFRTLLPIYGLQNIYQWEESKWLLSISTSTSLVFDTAHHSTVPFYPDTTRTDYRGGSFWISEQGSIYFKTGNGIYRIGGKIRYASANGQEFAYPEESVCLLEAPDMNFNGMQVIESGDLDDFWLCGKGVIRHYRYWKKAQPGQGTASGTREKLTLVKEYSIQNGESGEYAYGMTSDSLHRIWYSTQNGLVCIDPFNNRVTRYYEEDGLPTNKFFWGFLEDKQGFLYFCSTNGLVWFDPYSIPSGDPPRTYMTGLRIFNKPLKPGPDSPLENQLMYNDRITLPHDQNFLSMEFAALDYTGTRRVRYKYMLEGLDESWVNAGERSMAEYPDLKPGKYTFRVIAGNSNGVWNLEGASLGVTITPPFWLRWYSFAIEGILLLLLLVFIIRQRERNLRQRALELEQKLEEQTHQIIAQRKEVDDMKNRFYANVSHEFRTPLTLLTGPLEQALRKKRDEVSFKRNILAMMHRNARRLQNLINQLLDISKMETGTIKLQVSEGNLVEFLRTIIQSFLSLAESKKINYVYKVPEHESQQWFDRDKLEKILVNLLSNAFKFTPEKGEVRVTSQFLTHPGSAVPERIEIKVADTGKGIPDDQLHRIFDRFYQIEDHLSGDVEGSGIGLALTKELVELYRGEITVESKEGAGSTFTLRIPVSKAHFRDEERVGTEPTQTPSGSEKPAWHPAVDTEEPVEDHRGSMNGKPLVLIVEDNIDLQNYIAGCLDGEYRTNRAENGKKGFETARETVPDLVISDLMMPVMDGKEMCRLLKEDERTCHIPIVILTARADRESKLTGLGLGAESYLIKPFDAEELQVRIKSLIEQRRKLWQKFQRDLLATNTLKSPGKSGDQLIDKLLELMEQYYSDFDFSVDTLGDKLHMSRAQFFRKVHALTGQTPNELLRLYRIRKAASMIESGENNITGIMYEVGFRSTSHFARSFRKFYGKNPSEYRTTKPTGD